MRIQNLLLITGNPGKAEEFKELIDIKELNFSHRSLDLPEIQSFEIEDIARYKTQAALNILSEGFEYDAVLTDDTGLYCEGLNGLPGPFIKWFLDKLNAEGLHNLVKNGNTNTKAVCLLSLGVIKSSEIVQFNGTVPGRLTKPKGSGGFGWDAAFVPDGQSKTYGEMTEEEKNKISHRTLAVKQFRNWLLEDDNL